MPLAPPSPVLNQTQEHLEGLVIPSVGIVVAAQKTSRSRIGDDTGASVGVDRSEDKRQAAADTPAEQVRALRTDRVKDRQQVLNLDLDRHGANRPIGDARSSTVIVDEARKGGDAFEHAPIRREFVFHLEVPQSDAHPNEVRRPITHRREANVRVPVSGVLRRRPRKARHSVRLYTTAVARNSDEIQLPR